MTRVRIVDDDRAIAELVPRYEAPITVASKQPAVTDHHGHVLVIDNDSDITDIVSAVLTDAGFMVSMLVNVEHDAVRTAIGRLEPDCVLLDGDGVGAYGQSWAEAAWLGTRDRHVPVIMFTVDQRAAREAREATSARSQAAQFEAVLNKPFDLDELVDVVARAVGHAVPFDPSPAAEAQRTAQLRAKLDAAGAQEIHVSIRREWATFQTTDGTLVQLYWWQRDGVYYVVRYGESGDRLDQVGRFYDLDLAIALAMSIRRRKVHDRSPISRVPADRSGVTHRVERRAEDRGHGQAQTEPASDRPIGRRGSAS
jgi:DNA-binding response OmpR family regulator